MRNRDGTFVGARNEWRRGVISENGKAKPDHVLLDVGVMRPTGKQPEGVTISAVEWNCASLTPRQARRLAAALLTAAKECER